MTAYSMLHAVVQEKIQILKEEPNLENRTGNVLIHYEKLIIDEAMNRIIEENPDYEITYQVEINGVSLLIQSRAGS